MKPRVVLLATGGTIASRHDPALGRTVASQRAEALLAALPGRLDDVDVEIENLATMPSFDMTLDFAFALARRIAALCRQPDVSGVVVTHGTDTMEETSWLADLLLDGEAPAVFTGAQRAADDPQSDGPHNLLDALRVAGSPLARGIGAVVCFNGAIHAARDVTKVHTSAVETFQSYERGALGEVDGSRVIARRRPGLRRTFEVDRLQTDVALFRLAIGIDLAPLDDLVARAPAGLVIEGFGRGNGPRALASRVRDAVAGGCVVVMTSRCPTGRVEPIYGGGGGGRDLADAGALFGGDLKGAKLRLLLMVLLGQTRDRTEIEALLREIAP